jgi:hypothetical protein
VWREVSVELGTKYKDNAFWEKDGVFWSSGKLPINIKDLKLYWILILPGASIEILLLA